LRVAEFLEAVTHAVGSGDLVIGPVDVAVVVVDAFDEISP
jgi:hypothetical protein